MSDTLLRICASTRQLVAERETGKSLFKLMQALPFASAPRGFTASLRRTVAAGRFGLIAEIKRASPSRGVIRKDFDPPTLARAYAAAGVSCLSVLTDEPFFGGRLEDMVAARAAVPMPVLRKDFMLERYQVVEARAAGADAVLLIMAALTDAVAAALEAEADELGMDVLIEVHDEAELERALRLRSPLIGINNRDLTTLAVDLGTTERLAPLVPADRLLVCESGIANAGDLLRMQQVGVSCFLVGESLMRQQDVEAATLALLGATAPTEAAPIWRGLSLLDVRKG